MRPGREDVANADRPRPGHRPRKRFGQHFLEAAWAAKVVGAVAPLPGERLVEIGPGLGAITLPLAATGVPLRAIEVDCDLAAALRERVPAHVSIVCADFLALEAAEIFGSDPGPVRVVGNLPYNLSSPILFRLLELARATGRITDATLMLQREVADRVVARPGTGDYGPLAILLGSARHAHPDPEPAPGRLPPPPGGALRRGPAGLPPAAPAPRECRYPRAARSRGVPAAPEDHRQCPQGAGDCVRPGGTGHPARGGSRSLEAPRGPSPRRLRRSRRCVGSR